MEETFLGYTPTTTCAAPKPVEPKSNDTRTVEALESIASELLHIRRHLECLTDGGGGFGELPAAIRTTGR